MRVVLLTSVGLAAWLAAAVTSAATAAADEPKTLKERLSDKASDEQRVDNCRVPVERRGNKPRPDCPAAGAPVRPATPGAPPR